MGIKRFHFSLNEDGWFDKKKARYGFIFILIMFLFVILSIVPLKTVLTNEYLIGIFIILIIFGVAFFYTILLDIIPNILKNIPKFILIIVSFILLPIGLVVFRDINSILGIFVFIINNYVIGHDRNFDMNRFAENIIVSLIRALNFISSIILMLFAFLQYWNFL